MWSVSIGNWLPNHFSYTRYSPRLRSGVVRDGADPGKTEGWCFEKWGWSEWIIQLVIFLFPSSWPNPPFIWDVTWPWPPLCRRGTVNKWSYIHRCNVSATQTCVSVWVWRGYLGAFCLDVCTSWTVNFDTSVGIAGEHPMGRALFAGRPNCSFVFTDGILGFGPNLTSQMNKRILHFLPVSNR